MKRVAVRNLFLGWSLALGFTAHATEKVSVLTVDASINIGIKRYLLRAVNEAVLRHDAAVIVKLDTPGGYLQATREIVQGFLNSPVPVIVWVTPTGAHAASAGSMITMAAHYAAMAPSTSIGAATPVMATGQDVSSDMKTKVQNDTLSFVEGIAEKRGRNAAWARDSVTKASSLNATDALKMHVIDGIHVDRDDLWIGARKKFPTLPERVNFVDFPMTPQESFLDLVSKPDIAYGMLALGGLGIYMEISHPGSILPGAIGALFLGLGAITTDIIPIRPGAILLLIAGVALLALELLTPLPTYGVAGVAAAISLLLSGVFLLDPTQTNLSITTSFWFPSFFALLGFMIFIGYHAGRALKSGNYKQGITALLNQTATVVSTIGENEARILIRGELWSAKWHDETSRVAFQKGATVKVVEQKGLVAYVIPA